MKTYQWILVAVFGFFTLALVAGASVMAGYYYSTASLEPEVIVKTVEVEKPFEVVVTKEVIKEVVVTPTPKVVPTATPEPLAAVYPTEEPISLCNDAAWVVLQPNSDRLKIGQIARLHFRIRNTGDCIWDGYVLSSDGALPDIEIPLTYPGEIADIVYDFPVTNSFEVRWHLQAPMTGYGLSEPLLVSNSASPGIGLETIFYKVDAKEKKFNILCGPFGCKLNRNFRYR